MKSANYELILETTCSTLHNGTEAEVSQLKAKAIHLGETPELYYPFGFPPLPLAMTVSDLDKMLFRHAIPVRFLKGIYGTLLEPKAIYKSRTRPASVGASAIVLSFESIHLGPIVVAMHADLKLGRDRVNMVKSIYAKEDKSFESEWREEGLLLWHR
ncbi:hypothetical protein [Cupriavidus taiwanensis]|uniref:MuF-C-terminal domain-containing protein n=1 Tax=Cupriavidus taiwanensis TaxID=164546 RepID=UPI000E1FC701|nr:hypothetical protein [Cupriavidus taiwanensis]